MAGREFFELPNGHRRMPEVDGRLGTLFVTGHKIRKAKILHRSHERELVAGIPWRQMSSVMGERPLVKDLIGRIVLC